MRIGLAHSKRGRHKPHERHRVRRNLHQLGVACGKGLFRSVLQIYRVTGHAQPVILIVDGGAGAVDLALIHGGKERCVQRVGLHAGDGRFELAQNRIDGGGMPRRLHVERAGEFSFPIEFFHQVQYRLARPTHGGHAGAGIDGWFDGYIEGGDVLGGQLDHGHGALVSLA